MDILTTRVTEFLTQQLGRAPTSEEVANGIISPWTLSNVHNSLNVGQSVLSLAPGDDIQAAIDQVYLQAGGNVYLQAGVFNVSNDIVIPSNIHLIGVSSGGTTIDFGGGAYQIKVIGTAMTSVDSVFLQGFTVQNSSTDLIRAQYVFNFGGTDVKSVNGLSGLNVDNGDTFNWNIGYVDTCGTGILMSNMTGMTIKDTFLTNITSGGGYVADTCTNSIIFNSSLDTVVGNGYDMTACTNFGVEQVSILNVTGNGFSLDSSGTSFSLTQGLISNCSGDGLILKNTTSELQVMAMQFSNNTGFGVNVSDVGSTSNLFVGNTFANNTAGAFQDNGTGTLIRSNIGVADSP